MDLAAVLEIFEGAAEVAAAPVGFVRDVYRHCLRKLRIVGEDHYAGSLVQKRQPSVIVCSSSFTRLNVHGAGYRISPERFWVSRIDKDGGEVAIEDISEAVEIGLHGIAERAPYRQAGLIPENVLKVVPRRL